ncbi:hypothetical protein NGA_2101800, partial [Nannochloropsis gaditana CCMP526]|uniref:uncharacterized protein n=1 Tax=Nannochloropsis gaditana (strain CCMP526) TaxID=1093141 RepID=UPI00029F58CB
SISQAPEKLFNPFPSSAGRFRPGGFLPLREHRGPPPAHHHQALVHHLPVLGAGESVCERHEDAPSAHAGRLGGQGLHEAGIEAGGVGEADVGLPRPVAQVRVPEVPPHELHARGPQSLSPMRRPGLPSLSLFVVDVSADGSLSLFVV